ncbi:MAG: hypothetical protein IT548_04510 [Alphaproteobacteria bacterium]|nr:hypothetical protein [Alphaproteobacteria bacterium]
MLQGAIIGGVIGLIYGLLFMWRAKQAKGDRYLTEMPKRVISFTAPQTPDAVLAAVANGVSGLPATLEAKSASRVVLTDKATLSSFGFFYPIQATPAPGGGSTVEIGIASRGNQWGPLVTKAHNIFVDAAKKTLGVTA